MTSQTDHFRGSSWTALMARIRRCAGRCAIALLLAASLPAQQAAPESEPQPAPASTPAKPSASRRPGKAAEVSAITEDQIRRLLIGKDLFLRGGYLDNTLNFNEHGALIGHSPEGSYTLCAIRITKVRLLKHKVELEGARYGLHFLSALSGEAAAPAVDRVNITPRKKAVRITIDRELVIKEKPQKQKKEKSRKGGKKASPAARPASIGAQPAESPASQPSAPAAESTASSSASGADSTSPGAGPAEASTEAATDTAQAQSETAQTPAAGHRADTKSIPAAHSQAHANESLESAIDNVLAQGLDARMMAAMPEYWKLYYQPAGDPSAAWPQDPAVLRQSMVDKKARLVSAIDPASNQFAQDHSVAGVAAYRVVVGADGRPEQIAVGRPIGLGLDENAVQTLRKAVFEPAIKDGHPVPVVLDMTVEFRIYSNRTAEAAKPNPAQTPEQPTLPGPYSVSH